MTLEQLRIFVAVAERQHVTEAARVLNLAQSAVSHAVAALESRHAIRLFDRIGRRIELTEAGRAFLVEARLVLAQAAQAEEVLASFGTLSRGTLKVEASQTIAGYWLPRHLARFREAYPGIEIRLGIGNTGQVAEAVRRGEAELGFVEGDLPDAPGAGIRPGEPAEFASTVVARDLLVVVAAPDPSGIAGADETGPSAPPVDLMALDWVLREPGSGTRSVFEAALARRGLDPARLKVVMELPSNEAVRTAVEAGLGATALSASVAVPSLEAGLLYQLSVDLPERDFTLIRHARRAPSRVAQAFMSLVAGGRQGQTGERVTGGRPVTPS